MRRIALIPLLALGTIFGFAHGFHALHHGSCGRGGWGEQREVSQTVFAPAPAPAPAAAPVVVQQQAPAAPAQTLIIPIIVGAPAGAAQPTSYVVQVPMPSAAPVAPAPPIAPAPPAPAAR